ncbi:RNA chaperone Hfq [Bacillus paranthracis]
MYYKLDFLLQYLDHKQMPCKFVMQGGKVVKGMCRWQRRIYYLRTNRRANYIASFKGSIMDSLHSCGKIGFKRNPIYHA